MNVSLQSPVLSSDESLFGLTNGKAGSKAPACSDLANRPGMDGLVINCIRDGMSLDITTKELVYFYVPIAALIRLCQPDYRIEALGSC